MRRCAEHLFPLPFLPGMAATFADYLGMAMLTPALPYWCADEAGMTPARVATWTGAITTAQYAGAAMGNFAVGAAGDRLGAKRTLLATLLGDVALFTLTAVETRPGALLAIRLVAGASSPLVAALMYILQRAEDKAQTLKGVNAYSLSVNFGYAVGGVVVGLAYGAMGWLGLNLLSACVAGAALALARGERAAALRIFSRAVETTPDSAEARVNLAIALNQFGEHDEALSHAQKAVALKPMYAKAHHALGACYQDVGSERAAQRHWGIAEALASEEGEADVSPSRDPDPLAGIVGLIGATSTPTVLSVAPAVIDLGDDFASPALCSALIEAARAHLRPVDDRPIGRGVAPGRRAGRSVAAALPETALERCW